MLRFIATMLSLAVIPAKADNTFQYNISAEAGLAHVNGLLIAELDTWLKTSDRARFWSVDASLSHQFTDSLAIETGLTHYQEHYQNYPGYDFQLSTFYADTQYELQRGAVGLQLQRTEFDLDGSALLQQSSLGAYYSALLAKQYVVFLNLTGSDKTLANFTARNSKLWQTGVELFYLPVASNSVFSMSLGYTSEDSQDNFYSNNLYTAGLTYRQYYSLLGRSGQLDSGVKLQAKQFERYQFADILRRDNLTELYSHLILRLNTYLSSKLSLGYLNNNSTLGDFSYQEFSVKFGVTLSL